MKKYIWLLVFCIILASMIGCGKKKEVGQVEPKEEGLVLAKIGDEIITIDEFNQRIAGLPDNIRPIAEKNKAEYLDNLILETLLYKEALRRGLDRDKESQEFFQEAKKKILVARLVKEDVEDKIKISEKTLKDYYQEHKEDFKTPQLFRASHIMVSTMEEAVDIIDRLNAGALFGEMAKEYSMDDTSKRGGDVGYFSAGQMVPEFEDACLGLKIGEISGPVKTRFGYHIIKLTERRDPKLMEFDEVKDRIEMILMTKERQTFFANLVARLKSETDVIIYRELIEPQEEKEAEPTSEGLQEE